MCWRTKIINTKPRALKTDLMYPSPVSLAVRSNSVDGGVSKYRQGKSPESIATSRSVRRDLSDIPPPPPQRKPPSSNKADRAGSEIDDEYLDELYAREADDPYYTTDDVYSGV